MPSIPSWAPEVFTLINPYSGSMYFNYDDGRGLFLLRGTECSIEQAVRATTDNVPQADGSILHHRFLTGTKIGLVIELWDDSTGTQQVACDEKLAEMLDLLSGSLRSLLNAGDNEGRLAWLVDGQLTRMLDDVRLLEYPKFLAGVGEPIVTCVIDSEYPYAQDLTQTLTGCADGANVTVDNTGSADYFPVFQVNRLNGAPAGSSPVSSFTITNYTTGEQFVYDNSFPGAIAIPANRFAEITTFTNTIYQSTTATGPGNGRNLKAGVDELNSEYFALRVGSNEIIIDGCDMDILWAPAWA